jgi:hypothetical protein
LVRELVKTHTQGEGPWGGGEGSFVRFLRKLKELLQGQLKRKDVVGVLTKRCHMPPKAAKQLAENIGLI